MPPLTKSAFVLQRWTFKVLLVNSITDGFGSERPTPDIRFLLQDCVLSFILNNSVNSLSNLLFRDSFEKDKELTELFKVKGVGVRGQHPTVSGILTPISNRVKLSMINCF